MPQAMAVAETRKRNRIFGVLKTLGDLESVTVSTDDDKSVIWIEHAKRFVPDVKLKWCDVQKHYRVYLHVAGTYSDKTQSGYAVCTVKSPLVATGLTGVYAFLHKNRANARRPD
jgi:hypothetical protein